MADETLATASEVADVWPAFAALAASRQTSLIARASQRVLNHCRRPGFLLGAATETLDGRGLPRLWLSRRPIATIASVTVNGIALDNTNADAWYFRPLKGELGRGSGLCDLRFACPFPPGSGNVVVVYTGGYAAIPDLVIEATAWTAKWLFDQGPVSGVFEMEKDGDYLYKLQAVSHRGLPGSIASLLVDYAQDDCLL